MSAARAHRKGKPFVFPTTPAKLLKQRESGAAELAALAKRDPAVMQSLMSRSDPIAVRARAILVARK